MARKAKFKAGEQVYYSLHSGHYKLFIGIKGQYNYRGNPVVDLTDADGSVGYNRVPTSKVERLPEGVPEPITNSILRGTANTEQSFEQALAAEMDQTTCSDTNLHYVEPQPNKYERQIINKVGESITVDIYDVLDAFIVTDAAVAHAIKKLLAPGQRGTKTVVQDLQESIASIERAIDRQHSKHLRG